MVDPDNFDGLVVPFKVAVLASMRLHATIGAQDLACFRANEVSRSRLLKVFVALSVRAAGKSTTRIFPSFRFRILVGFPV